MLQRGPTGDTDEDYNGNGADDDACFPGDKASQGGGRRLGRDAARQPPSRHATARTAAPARYTISFVTACTTHAGRARDLRRPVLERDRRTTTPSRWRRSDQKSPYKLNATGTFDGWGYMGLYSTTPDADGKLPMLDAYAIPEALDEAYANDFGDLTIHEQATDPTVPLSYSSYYAGGLRVFSYAGEQIADGGAFVDEGGSNFWGIEQFTTPAGVRLMAGLGPRQGPVHHPLHRSRVAAAGAAARHRRRLAPTCTDTVAIVRSRPRRACRWRARAGPEGR